MVAVGSALLIALGVGLIYTPAGLIVGGIEGLTGAWFWAYLDARRPDRRPR